MTADPPPISPRSALDAARFHLAEAEGGDPEDRARFRYRLEASIVTGRSVWHYLEQAAKRARDPAFRTWFKATSNSMKVDPVLEFFRHERDRILKERRLQTTSRRVFTALVDALIVRDRASTKVLRGKPWYRRPLTILVEDARRPVVEWIAARRLWASLGVDLAKRRAQTLLQAIRLRRHQLQATSSLRDYYFGADPEGIDRPAVDLVREYLRRLDVMLTEAETRFPSVFR